MPDFGTTARRSDIFADVNKVGGNYTGVGGVGFAGGQYLRYGFVLIKDSTLSASTLVNSKQVILSLNPQSVTEEEPSATNITFAQNSGKYIERRGSIAKTITIAGTTAFNYNPVLPQAVRALIPASATVLREGPTSGQAKFLQLRNLFREYNQIFSDEEYIKQRENTFMVFINEKDDEAWVVEPMSFSMSRQSPTNKFTYQYQISMQTIMPADNVRFAPETTTLFDDIKNFKGTIATIANNVSNIATSIGNAQALVSGAIYDAVDAVHNVLGIIASGLTAIAQGSESRFALADYIKGSAINVSNTFMGAYTRLMNVRDAVSAASGSDPLAFVYDQLLTKASDAISLLAGRQELFSNTFSDTWNKTISRYTPAYGVGGYDQSLILPASYNGVKEVSVLAGDTLIRIASRELGDANRFREIAALNALKQPYVSPSASERMPNTVAPGDTVLIPVIGSADATRVPIRTTVFSDPTSTSALRVTTASTAQMTVDTTTYRVNQWAGFTFKPITGLAKGIERKIVSNTVDTLTFDRPYSAPIPTTGDVGQIYLKRISTGPATLSKSAQDQALGIDLQMVNNDLVVDSTGHLTLVTSIDNMTQAIQAKLKSRPGDLPAHPTFGLGFDPGVRATQDTLFTYRVAVKQTLLSDPRVSSVEQLAVTATGSTLALQGYVLLAGRPQPYALDTRGAL